MQVGRFEEREPAHTSVYFPYIPLFLHPTVPQAFRKLGKAQARPGVAIKLEIRSVNIHGVEPHNSRMQCNLLTLWGVWMGGEEGEGG